MDKRKMSQSGATTAAGRMAYEGKVGVEAVVRSGGKNPQLKGVVHEILYRDSITMAPDNLIHGTKGALSKSATAIRDDVLTMQGGKVIGRAQLKDTVSSINKTVKQASSGKYAGTNLMGTKETAAAYNNSEFPLLRVPLLWGIHGLHQGAAAGTAPLPFSSAPATAGYRRMQFLRLGWVCKGSRNRQWALKR